MTDPREIAQRIREVFMTRAKPDGIDEVTAILAAEMPRWVPVEEKLPELKEVYTGGPKKANVMVFTGRYVCEGTLEETFVKRIPRWKNGYDRGIPVTHWQPLPSPPREDTPRSR